MDIPAYLSQQIRDGKVVLFLGAGAAIGAIPTGDVPKIPDAAGLASLLADRFLGGAEKNRPLSIVADYAIDASDLVTVQGYVREIFTQFTPATFQRKIPDFRWAAAVTTNYDQLLEAAYGEHPKALQKLCPISKTTDKIEEILRAHNSIAYLKLHGCISRWEDKSIPLILTIDQYGTHRKNRERLFERFKSYASDLTVVYVGYRLEDPDFRAILQEISSEDISRPRHFVVLPGPNPRDVRLWEKKKIECIDGTFEEFLNTLEALIPAALRSVRTSESSHPIERQFNSHQRCSPSTLAFLNNDVTYLYAGMSTEQPNAKAFYKGFSIGWSAIAAKLDAHRGLSDQLLNDIVICDDSERPRATDLYLIKGYAGSGKSILLKRLAWSTAVDFEKLALFLKSDGHLAVEQLQELSDLTGERLFVFVDRASTRNSEIERIVSAARTRRLRVTFIIAERTNEWNTDCQTLASLVDETYELRGLSPKEINAILDKLAANNSLGTLNGLSRVDQVKSFTEHASRQLLVALYEATSGKPFEDIVFDEYTKIVPDQAQRMYLVICSLSRLQIPVRAGIVKRITGISFEDFRSKFFSPLESIVFTEEYKPALDMAYRARHPWIAETVFERALTDQQSRFELYVQLLSVLDPGYQADRIAYREIVRARHLLKDFSDPLLVANLYNAAQTRFGDDPYFLQQMGIFEMKRNGGNLDVAHSLLVRARDGAPRDMTILHSLSELELERASRATRSIERDHHLRAAKEIAISLTGKNAESAHGYVTVAKVGFEKLEELLKDGAVDEVGFTALVKEIETSIQEGLQRFASDEFLWSAEARLAEMIDKEDKAVAALERAYKTNAASPFISRSLARLYERRNDIVRARATLEATSGAIPHDKSVNGALARLYSERFPDDGAKAEQCWRRSFTDGDSNNMNQFWYARQLFVNGKPTESKEWFKKIRTARVAPDVKQKMRGSIKNVDGTTRMFRGHVPTIEATYAWLSVDGESFFVFCHKSNVPESLWANLRVGNRVTFSLAFNFFGPTASNLVPV